MVFSVVLRALTPAEAAPDFPVLSGNKKRLPLQPRRSRRDRGLEKRRTRLTLTLIFEVCSDAHP